MITSKPKLCDACDEQTPANIFQGSFEEQTYQHLLSNEKTILINNDINSNLIERLVIPIIIMNKADDIREENDKQFVRQNEPINILINSGGGNAHETMSAVSVILSSETPVHTYALGKAMSGGFYILIAGHQRYAQMFSSVLYHQIQCGFGGTQPAQQHIEHMTENLRLQSALDAVIFERTKIKKKKLDEINSRKQDWIFSQEELLKYGIIDDFAY